MDQPTASTWHAPVEITLGPYLEGLHDAVLDTRKQRDSLLAAYLDANKRAELASIVYTNALRDNPLNSVSVIKD